MLAFARVMSSACTLQRLDLSVRVLRGHDQLSERRLSSFKIFIFPFWCSVFFLLISFRFLIIKLFCRSALPCSPTVGRG